MVWRYIALIDCKVGDGGGVLGQWDLRCCGEDWAEDGLEPEEGFHFVLLDQW